MERFYQSDDRDTERAKNDLIAIFARRVTGGYYYYDYNVNEEKYDDPSTGKIGLNAEFFSDLKFSLSNTSEKYDTYAGFLLALRDELSLLINADFRVGEVGNLCINNPQDLEELADSIGNLDGIMGHLLVVNPFTPKGLLQDLANESFSPGSFFKTTAHLVHERLDERTSTCSVCKQVIVMYEIRVNFGRDIAGNFFMGP